MNTIDNKHEITRWVTSQRTSFKKGTLKPWKFNLLKKHGFKLQSTYRLDAIKRKFLKNPHIGTAYPHIAEMLEDGTDFDTIRIECEKSYQWKCEECGWTQDRNIYQLMYGHKDSCTPCKIKHKSLLYNFPQFESLIDTKASPDIDFKTLGKTEDIKTPAQHIQHGEFPNFTYESIPPVYNTITLKYPCGHSKPNLKPSDITNSIESYPSYYKPSLLQCQEPSCVNKRHDDEKKEEQRIRIWVTRHLCKKYKLKKDDLIKITSAVHFPLNYYEKHFK